MTYRNPRGKNEEFVAYIPDLDCNWLFTIETSAVSMSETATEMIDIFEYILQAADSFITPTEIECILTQYEADEPPVKGFDVSKTSPTNVQHETLDSKEAVSYSHFRKHATHLLPKDGIGTFYEFNVEDAMTKVRLADGDVDVDNTDNMLYRFVTHDGVINKPPTWNPLKINLYWRVQPLTREPVYKVVIESATDIWFEETEIGAANRKRLGHFLAALRNHPNTIDANFHSSHYGADGLRSKGYDELVPDL